MAPHRLSIATLFAIGLLGAPWFLLEAGQLSPVTARHVLVSFIGSAPLLFVYLRVLWLLRNGQPKHAAGLLALGAGCALGFSLPALLPVLLAARPCSGYWDVGATLALFPIGQTAIVATALQARRALAGAGAISRWSLLWPLAFLMAAMVTVPSPPFFLHDRLDRNDAGALRSISEIRDCAKDYAAKNPAIGYPASLASCGAASAHTGTAGHLIRYQPAAPAGDGRINGYRASARPQAWGCTSWMSYWSDESGALHRGALERPADEPGAPR